jgi:hypothetical protein
MKAKLCSVIKAIAGSADCSSEVSLLRARRPLALGLMLTACRTLATANQFELHATFVDDCKHAQEIIRGTSPLSR